MGRSQILMFIVVTMFTVTNAQHLTMPPMYYLISQCNDFRNDNYTTTNVEVFDSYSQPEILSRYIWMNSSCDCCSSKYNNFKFWVNDYIIENTNPLISFFSDVLNVRIIIRVIELENGAFYRDYTTELEAIVLIDYHQFMPGVIMDGRPDIIGSADEIRLYISLEIINKNKQKSVLNSPVYPIRLNSCCSKCEVYGLNAGVFGFSVTSCTYPRCKRRSGPLSILEILDSI